MSFVAASPPPPRHADRQIGQRPSTTQTSSDNAYHGRVSFPRAGGAHVRRLLLLDVRRHIISNPRAPRNARETALAHCTRGHTARPWRIRFFYSISFALRSFCARSLIVKPTTITGRLGPVTLVRHGARRKKYNNEHFDENVGTRNTTGAKRPSDIRVALNYRKPFDCWTLQYTQ